MTMKYIFMLFGLLISGSSCNKFLAAKADASMPPPLNVADYQALLDNMAMTTNSTPGLGEMAVDDYVMDSAAWLAAGAAGKGIYIWQPLIYQGSASSSWSNPYKVIYTANVVLDGIRSLSVKSSDSADRNFVCGSAMFLRAFQHLCLEETFGQPYRPATATSDIGVPLRLSADALEPITRSSVQAVFMQADSDLLQAVRLLPIPVQRNNRNRPCRPAAWALLARSALVQQNYRLAQLYADSCLALYNVLAGYDTVRTSTPRPFYTGSGNDEVLFQCSAMNYPAQYATTSHIDSTLYNSYASGDLRRTVFFQRTPAGDGYYFKGGYTGLLYLFTGLATDEVYLIRAECSARLGDVTAALSYLNTLLSHRWKPGTFANYTAATADEALSLVLMERRKETVFRDLRWSDLRRLNQDPRFAATLTRRLGSTVYQLLPNDVKYTFLIPDEEIQASGISQNPVQ
jgi:hypothetical protein